VLLGSLNHYARGPFAKAPTNNLDNDNPPPPPHTQTPFRVIIGKLNTRDEQLRLPKTACTRPKELDDAYTQQ
jgi:hypothetical protein